MASTDTITVSETAAPTTTKTVAPRFPKAKIAKGTPKEFRDILRNDSETSLLKLLTGQESYPVTVTVYHRLSQLRERHAVDGILQDAAYKTALNKTQKAQAILDEAQETLQQAMAQSRDLEAATKQAESERADIQAAMLGYEWKYQLAVETLEALPEYRQMVADIEAAKTAQKKTVARDTKTIKAAKKKLAVAIIRNRSDLNSPVVTAAREEVQRLEQGDAPDPAVVTALEADLETFRTTMIGEVQYSPEGERSLTGGELDLTEAYAIHEAAVESEVETAIQERAMSIAYSGHTELRKAVVDAENLFEQASMDLQIHQAAIRRAEGRVRRARETEIVYEPQTVDTSMAAQIKAHPGLPRAIFVQDSVFLDHLLYAEWRRSREATTQNAAVFEIAKMSDPSQLPIPSNIFVIPTKLKPSAAVKWRTELQLALVMPVPLPSNQSIATTVEQHLETYAPTVHEQALEASWRRLVIWASNKIGTPKSHKIWTDGDSSFHVFGDIPRDNEKRVLDVFSANGAKVTAHELDVPEYRSWADIKPGNRLTLTFPDGNIHFVPHHELSKNGKVSKADHSAPFSERGILHIDGMTPAQAVAALQELGLSGDLVSHVPYELVYRGTHRLGRVTPLYEPFASGREALRLPDGHMILHGVTGAGGNATLSRLRTIIQTGGLKSIAERRRMNIHVTSMSPLGDIASGTDTGVPTKFGDRPSYGGGIFFGMHPEILHRRDLWFSDRDFGGGHNRYDSYLKYARSIGQQEIYLPCPVSGRQKHIDSGLGGTNEAYFRHDISWNDVDTLFVTDGFFDDVNKMVREYQQEGLLPQTLKVVAFGDGDGGDVSDSWEVDEATGEVFYMEGFEGQATRRDIGTVLSARAREIMKTLE